MANNPYVEKIHEYAQWVFPFNSARVKNWHAIFGNNNPIGVDLGSGAGNFLTQLACQMPEWNWVGFELRFKRLVRSAQKAKHLKLQNVRFVQARAETFAQWFMPESVHFCSVHFPDPWPKKKQHKNRLIQPAFIESLVQTLAVGGFFSWKSDHQEYSEQAIQIFQERFANWQPNYAINQTIVFPEMLRQTHPNTCALQEQKHTEKPIIHSEFEQLFSQKNHPIYSFQWKKSAADNPC